MDCLPEMLKALADEMRFAIVRLITTLLRRAAKHLGISERGISTSPNPTKAGW